MLRIKRKAVVFVVLAVSNIQHILTAGVGVDVGAGVLIRGTRYLRQESEGTT